MQADAPGVSFRKKLLAGILIAAVAVCCISALYFIFHFGLVQKAASLIDRNTPAWLFLVLMIFLPLAWFPLSAFVFVLGVKFGIVCGIIILEAVMPVHILASYAIARGVRRPLTAFLTRWKKYSIPEIPENKAALFSFLFLAVPVFPYAAKNYILPLAGAPFRYCMWMNWAVQGAVSIPFVILGKSAAEMNLLLFGGTVAFLAFLFAFLRWLKRWYERLESGL